MWRKNHKNETWKYKLKLRAEAASRGFYKKAVRKNFAIFTRKPMS